MWQASRLASIGAGGILADTIGIATVYYFGGCMLLLAAGIGFARLRTRDIIPRRD